MASLNGNENENQTLQGCENWVSKGKSCGKPEAQRDKKKPQTMTADGKSGQEVSMTVILDCLRPKATNKPIQMPNNCTIVASITEPSSPGK